MLSVCLPVCLSACHLPCLSVCMFVSLPVCLSVSLSFCPHLSSHRFSLCVCLCQSVFLPICLSVCFFLYVWFHTWCPLAYHFSPVPHDLSVCLSVFHLLFFYMSSCLSVFFCCRWPDKPGGGADQPQHQLPRHVRSGYTQSITLLAFLKNVEKKLMQGRFNNLLFVGDRAY